jgi:hypothetical protein
VALYTLAIRKGVKMVAMLITFRQMNKADAPVCSTGHIDK